VHLVDDALEASNVLLAACCRDRHLSAGSSLPESQGQPINLCLSGFAPAQDAEVDDDAPVLGERNRELSSIHHTDRELPRNPGEQPTSTGRALGCSVCFQEEGRSQRPSSLRPELDYLLGVKNPVTVPSSVKVPSGEVTVLRAPGS
jgi:hypothetical protein